MNKLLLAIAMLFGGIAFSQDSANAAKWVDSTAIKAKEYHDDTQHFLDSMRTAQGLNDLLRIHNEQKEKQKKKAILYIGMGIFFLVILVVGLMRRSRSASGK